MKQTPLFLILTLLLFTACEPPEYPTLVSGTLYTDSTLTTPGTSMSPKPNMSGERTFAITSSPSMGRTPCFEADIATNTRN